MENLIHFEKINGRTTAHNFDAGNYTQEEKNRIRREVISSRGELLFSKAIVLCEGVTEEQALPIFFREKFDIEPAFCGISIIGIGGQNYKTFLSLIKDFNINWFIFSDGETQTIKTVTKAIRDVFNADIQTFPNVIILDDGEDYERHLLNSGYEAEIVSAICEYEGDPEFVNNYIHKRDHTSAGREKTDQPECPTCHQPIYRDIIRNYSGDEGYRQAIYDCCTAKQAKAKYATEVAEKIVSISDENRRIPPKIKSLLDAMSFIVSNEGEPCDAAITETTTNSQS